MINVYAIDTLYVEIEELVGVEGNEFVFHIEWGNGEGFDELRVSIS